MYRLRFQIPPISKSCRGFSSVRQYSSQKVQQLFTLVSYIFLCCEENVNSSGCHFLYFASDRDEWDDWACRVYTVYSRRLHWRYLVLHSHWKCKHWYKNTNKRNNGYKEVPNAFVSFIYTFNYLYVFLECSLFLARKNRGSCKYKALRIYLKKGSDI